MEILLALAVMGLCFLGLGVGALFSRGCLRGSCGGEPIRIAGVKLGCGACPEKEGKPSGEDGKPAPETIDV